MAEPGTTKVWGEYESVRFEVMPHSQGLEVGIRPESDQYISTLQSHNLFLSVDQAQDWIDQLQRGIREVQDLQS